MSKTTQGRPVTYYTEYDEEILLERVEGLVSSFVSYVKGRKKLDEDYSESEYNPNDKEIYRQISIVMGGASDGHKNVRLQIEYGNGSSDIPMFHGSESHVRAWVSTLSVEDVYDMIVGCFDKWSEKLL